jgi:hypothetical protein
MRIGIERRSQRIAAAAGAAAAADAENAKLHVG